MAKQKKRHGPSTRYDANRQRAVARLDAILREAEALIDSGRREAAARLLEQNLARFAQYAELRAMLASLYGELGRYREAAEHARMAIDLAPNRTEYQLLAAMAYQSAGFRSFAARERRAWLEAQPSGELLPLMRELDAAFGAAMRLLQATYNLPGLQTAEKAGLLLDEGRWAMDHSRWPDALEHSRAASALAPAWPSPRNNVTLALIYLARYREAREAARAVLADLDADNVHALAHLVQTAVILQEPDEAKAAADRLATLAPMDPEELAKQIQGLAWLDRDADIDRLLKAARRKRVPIVPDVYVHWGVAAANAGRRREALEHLRRADEAGVRSTLLRVTLDALEDKLPGPGISSRYPQTSFSDLLPEDALKEAIRLMVEQGETGYRDQAAWNALNARYPQLLMALERIMVETPNSVEPTAHLIAAIWGSEAKDTLLRFMRGQVGSDEDRMAVLRVMQQVGVVAADEPVQIWLKGERQEVRARLYDLSDDFPSNYPEEAIDLYERAMAAHAKGQLPEAIELYRRALSVEPNLKEAYNNLGAALVAQGDTEGAKECIEKALAIDPLYVFPLVSRALQALYSDGAAAAKEVLAPLEAVTRWRPLEMVMYQKGLARIALVERDFVAARNSLEIASQINPEDAELPTLQAQLRMGETLPEVGGMFADWDERSRQRRLHKKLPPDPTLADCLGIVPVGDMVGIARVLRLWVPAPRKRVNVESHMLANLQEPELVQQAVAELSEPEQSALRAILAANGVLAWERFVEQFGDEKGDRPYLEYHSEKMTSLPGRLRARGLIYYGTIEGQESVVIPRESRPLIQEALDLPLS